MNKELIKELNIANFPFKKIGCHECDEGRERHDFIDGTLFEPTLSELIEACGDKFEVLKKEKDQWRATWFDGITEINGYGSTPEEAVMRLWLEINKK